MTEGLNEKRKRGFPMYSGDTGIPLCSNRYDSLFFIIPLKGGVSKYPPFFRWMAIYKPFITKE
jgi:hypothetical protein